MKRSRQRILALASVLLFLMGFAPTIAAADDPTFNVSVSSALPGREVVISQGDPCPAPPPMSSMYVAVSFTDANNVTTWVDQAWPTGGSGWGVPGEWDFTRSFYIPLTAAQGVGSFQAYCLIPGQPGHALDYAPQSLTVSGAPAELELSKEKVQRGETVHIEADVSCPVANSYVGGSVSISSPFVYVPFSTTANSAGEWSVDVTIPHTFSDPMGGPAIELPLDTYTVRAECVNSGPQQGAGLRYAENSLLVYVAYVGLGDSYSAGLGAYNYDGSSGSCYRSYDSYVQFVADDQNLGTPLFKACSGAVTDDFYNQNPSTGEPPQQMWLTDGVQKITLTVGGNDAGFADVLDRCAQSPQNSNGYGCSTDPTLIAELQDRFDALAGFGSATTPQGRPIASIEQLLRSIHASAEDAQIFIADYPRLFGDDIANYTTNANAPGGASCGITAGVGATVSFDDAKWLNQKADQLSDIIYDAVEAVQADGIEAYFVSSALFTGHGLYDAFDEWITPVVLDASNNPLPESLHPRAIGYSFGYGEAFVAIMNQH